jgi:hypothetical protein
MTELDDSFIILKYNVFIDRAPCTKLHKREQKDSTKTLPEFPNHVLKDYGGACALLYHACIFASNPTLFKFY